MKYNKIKVVVSFEKEKMNDDSINNTDMEFITLQQLIDFKKEKDYPSCVEKQWESFNGVYTAKFFNLVFAYLQNKRKYPLNIASLTMIDER